MLTVRKIEQVVGGRERVEFKLSGVGSLGFTPGEEDADIVSMTVMAPAGTFLIGDYFDGDLIVEDEDG